MRDLVRVVNAEVIRAEQPFRMDKVWVFRVLPLYNETVRVELPAAEDCAAEGALCTADGRGLSKALVWEVYPRNPTRWTKRRRRFARRW